MDRPSVYAKSVRKGTVSTILGLVLLSAACLVHVTPSPAVQADNDATLRHMVQYIMNVGQQQYDRGYYSEAQKTFERAQEHASLLDSVEQRKLESLRARQPKAPPSAPHP